jgi:DNA-binding transcriptional ArsR family regulator
MTARTCPSEGRIWHGGDGRRRQSLSGGPAAAAIAKVNGQRAGRPDAAPLNRAEPLTAPSCQTQLSHLTCNSMVVRRFEPDEVDRVFTALADPTRRDILARVLTQTASVSTLAERYEMSFAAVQRHVAVLERAGLVSKQPSGRERLVRGEVDTVRAAARLLDQYEDIWRGRLGRLGDLLADQRGNGR